MATVDWMWFGNRPQINETPGTPSTDAEADSVIGHTAVGTSQIKAVSLEGETRTAMVNDQPAEVFATSFNTDEAGNDIQDSAMTYLSPQSGDQVTSTITGFLKVHYELTYPDGSTQIKLGALIQMANGDMFFRPRYTSASDWDGVTELRSIKILSADPHPQNSYVGTNSFSPTVVDGPVTCFASGTLIQTDRGEREVQHIAVGDLVMTRDNGLQRVLWVGSRYVSAAEIAENPALAPVRIAAGSIGCDVPTRDLVVSQQHRVLVRSSIAMRMFGARELLIAAKHLVEVDGIDIQSDPDGVTYVHLMFAAHEIIVSNGAQSESLYPGRQALLALGNAAEGIFALFPQLRHAVDDFPGARPFVAGKKARQLAKRHVSNRQPLAS